jgi:hypothetical protein
MYGDCLALASLDGHDPVGASARLGLADLECHHGRLPFDRTAACGCWRQEGAVILPLP